MNGETSIRSVATRQIAANEIEPLIDLCRRYMEIRRQTEGLCKDLQLEDYGLQAMPSVSPVKWHLAHTTWFFETFLLRQYRANYQTYAPAFEQLFNSYYQGIGAPFPRAQRGLLSRPTVHEVYAYRHAIDEQVFQLLQTCAAEQYAKIAFIVTLGMHHEQQHQELLLTDIKYNFSVNPLLPIYRPYGQSPINSKRENTYRTLAGGVVEIGHDGDDFAFDNETPRHKVYLTDFQLATHLVTNAEYLEFILDGGYRKPHLWLADGWAVVQASQWCAPLYWLIDGSAYREFTLRGVRELDLHAPLTHISYYEADAYARWAGARLPTEAEWEYAAAGQAFNASLNAGNFLENDVLHPCQIHCAGEATSLQDMLGNVWEWTQSPYAPYPGFEPFADAMGEYNGKFMCNQMVLRGGSCVTPRMHIRTSYRNFFYPQERWQFTGIRLAKDA